ncbi:unnamed protein product [Phaeothamnion confervicola]
MPDPEDDQTKEALFDEKVPFRRDSFSGFPFSELLVVVWSAQITWTLKRAFRSLKEWRAAEEGLASFGVSCFPIATLRRLGRQRPPHTVLLFDSMRICCFDVVPDLLRHILAGRLKTCILKETVKPNQFQRTGSESNSPHKQVEELERALDLPLQVVFMKQLLLLRDRALQRFKAAAKGSEQADYQAMVAAATFFDKEARASVKQGSSWDFARERQALTSTMAELAQRTKRTADAQLKAAQAQNTAFAFLQAQQQQIAQLQQQMYGGGNSPWGLSAAYRIPDTAIDVQGSYQGGGASVTFSCAADDQNPMLGASGFTQGFGPGNVGLTLKVNI